MAKKGLDAYHEPAVEFAAHGTNGKQKVVAFASLEMMPHTMFIHSTSRHYTVNMRMVVQIRAPRMENSGHTSEQASLFCKSLDGGPCSLEHTFVEDGLMSHSPRMQTVRHSEYDVEVFGRDDFLPAELNPLLSFLVLTLGAMTIPAAVIADADIPAFGTNLHMPVSVRTLDLA